MVMDETTTIAELKDAVAAFVAIRDWQQFHTGKNLAMSIAIEAAEIMEHFQWQAVDEGQEVLGDDKVLAEVADELADVLIYCLSFAGQANIDISEVVKKKLARNERRFPVDKVRGTYKKGGYEDI